MPDLNDDIIDVRDITERVDELRAQRDDEPLDADEADELRALEMVLDELRGYGGDHQWEGDWYPLTLIRDSYFQEYAQELAEDIGAIDRHASWPNNCIDWEQAARELRVDYTPIDIGRVTYWYR